ncbi:MAG: hypothetical protein ABEJ68_02785 [Halobacteriaceae archaeon]
MDRIAALRNVEEALSDLETGEVDLATAERRVVGVLRTYVTEFDAEDGRSAYRAGRPDPADDLVVVAESASEARERANALTEDGSEFEIERID